MYKKKFTIIITAENKENFLLNTINSCLKQSYSDFEIILAYSYLKNINLLKEKYNNKIIFKKINHKKKYSTQDQFYKIKKSLEIANGELIVLLDGDDCILRNKLKEIASSNFNKLLVHDYLNNYSGKKILVNFHSRKFNFINFITNQWPKNFCTSSIVINHKSLKLFFEKIKNKNFFYVAIDALLIIFYQKNIFYKKKILTIKNDVPHSVDKFFLGLFNKFFWLRRIEQHNFYNNININSKKNFDYFISLLLAKIFSYF